MIIPAAMFIEQATDRVVKRAQADPDGARVIGMAEKELHVANSLMKMGLKQEDYGAFLAGYLVGVETMRQIVASSPAAIKAGLEF